MAVSEELADQIRALPDQAGIYVFRDRRRRPLYVGKAKCRSPVASSVGAELVSARAAAADLSRAETSSAPT